MDRPCAVEAPTSCAIGWAHPASIDADEPRPPDMPSEPGPLLPRLYPSMIRPSSTRSPSYRARPRTTTHFQTTSAAPRQLRRIHRSTSSLSHAATRAAGGGVGGRGGGAWREARSAAGRAARVARFHPLTRGPLFERSERRERSELGRAPVLRAPQRSRSEAETSRPAPAPDTPPRHRGRHAPRGQKTSNGTAFRPRSSDL